MKNETIIGTVRVVTPSDKKVHAKEWLAVQLIRQTEWQIEKAIEKRGEYDTLMKNCKALILEVEGKLESAKYLVAVRGNTRGREFSVKRLTKELEVLKKSFSHFANEWEIWNCTVEELMP